MRLAWATKYLLGLTKNRNNQSGKNRVRRSNNVSAVKLTMSIEKLVKGVDLFVEAKCDYEANEVEYK